MANETLCASVADWLGYTFLTSMILHGTVRCFVDHRLKQTFLAYASE